MTNKDCDIIQDLLPLYIDSCCHPGSRELVEAHLKTCPACQKVFSEMTGDLPAPEPPQPEPETPSAPEVMEEKKGKSFRKGMRKIRRRWIASLIAVVVLVPLVLMGINQARGFGLCYTNLHEFYLANAFLGKMKAGDYEGAAQYMNREDVRERYLFSWFTEEEMANFDRDVTDTFVAAAQGYTQMGGLSGYRYHWGGYAAAYQCSESFDGVPVYQFEFTLTIGDIEYRAILEASKDGVENCWVYDNPMGGPQQLNAINQWEYTLWDAYVERYYDDARKAQYTCFVEQQAYESGLQVAAG